MESIAKYWAQITVVLMALSYLVQQFMSYRLRLKEIKFTSLHLERAGVVRKLYLDIKALQKDIELMKMAHYLHPRNMGPTREEWLPIFQRIMTRNKEIMDYFDSNSILFSRNFGRRMRKLNLMVTEKFVITSTDKNHIIKDPNKDLILTDSHIFNRYYHFGFMLLLRSLENQFRRYL